MGRSKPATLACAGVFAMVVGFGIASAQSAPASAGVQRASTTVAQPVDDHHFVVQAALANMAEVQLGHLAKEKARQADVKKFAQMMIEDHLKTQKALADAAYGAGIEWPTQLDDKHRQIKQRLSTAKRDQFDRDYMKAMVDGHRAVEELLVTYVSGSGSQNTDTLAANVSAWATETLPAVRAHLEEAEQVYGQLDKGK